MNLYKVGYLNSNDKIWVISDTHFYHKNIIKYCNRPFKDEYEMTEVIIKNWNNKISKRSIVIHLGDFMWKKNEKLKELHGRIYLVKGNHDNNNKINWLIKNEIIVDWFDKLYINWKLKIFLCMHELPNLSLIPLNYDYILHGHTHQLRVTNNIFTYGLEDLNYQPMKLEDIFKKMKGINNEC